MAQAKTATATATAAAAALAPSHLAGQEKLNNAKLVNGHAEVDETPRPPLPDDYMYDFKYNHPLPTFAVLGTEITEDEATPIEAQTAAEVLLSRLADCLVGADTAGFTDLFVEYGVWRDKLAFSWDYRTFNHCKSIAKAAKALVPCAKPHSFCMEQPPPAILRPYPDIAYLQFTFAFKTNLVGASAVANAVKTAQGWKIWTLHTVIESLHQFPEVTARDGHMTGLQSWHSQRLQEDSDMDPDVLIIGGGQNGLALAACLKALQVPTLIVERAPRVGDTWRNRYEYLSLHMPHWADHFPYFPFPDHWPTYTPAQKLGLFMEWYASAMELSVWTSSSVCSAKQVDNDRWTVVVQKGDTKRILRPRHVVMATSLCGVPLTPIIPGMKDWRGGTFRHSTSHDSARGLTGKRVLVVGTSSSGFDTALDCARHKVDVTILQRSPTYIMSLTHSVPRLIGAYEPKNGVRPNIEQQDRLAFGMPLGPGEELARRNTQVLRELDRDMLDGLHKRGLRTWKGQRETGVYTLGQTRNGGFYFEAGACEQIIKGSIKIKAGHIERFSETKVILSDGSEEHYDLVVFATGFSNTIDSVRATLGDDIADRCGPIWGIDEEGEFRSAYKESGVPGLWMMVGFLPYTRFHSKRLALRLKALIEGVSPPPYKD